MVPNIIRHASLRCAIDTKAKSHRVKRKWSNSSKFKSSFLLRNYSYGHCQVNHAAKKTFAWLCIGIQFALIQELYTWDEAIKTEVLSKDSIDLYSIYDSWAKVKQFVVTSLHGRIQKILECDFNISQSINNIRELFLKFGLIFKMLCSNTIWIFWLFCLKQCKEHKDVRPLRDLPDTFPPFSFACLFPVNGPSLVSRTHHVWTYCWW